MAHRILASRAGGRPDAGRFVHGGEHYRPRERVSRRRAQALRRVPGGGGRLRAAPRQTPRAARRARPRRLRPERARLRERRGCGRGSHAGAQHRREWLPCLPGGAAGDAGGAPRRGRSGAFEVGLGVALAIFPFQGPSFPTGDLRVYGASCAQHPLAVDCAPGTTVGQDRAYGPFGLLVPTAFVGERFWRPRYCARAPDDPAPRGPGVAAVAERSDERGRWVEEAVRGPGTRLPPLAPPPATRAARRGRGTSRVPGLRSSRASWGSRPR